MFDIYDIWHLLCIYISIWVSKEAANYLRYPTQIFLGPKIEIFYFLIFPSYISDFPLYSLGGLRSVASHGKELFPVIFFSGMPQNLQEIENVFISDFWFIMGHPSHPHIIKTSIMKNNV